MSAVDGLASLLQLADGFIEQAHFAEGDTQVVVGFWILFGGGSADFEIVFEFAEHFREIDPSFFTEWRRGGCGGSAGNDWRCLRFVCCGRGCRLLRSRGYGVLRN